MRAFYRSDLQREEKRKHKRSMERIFGNNDYLAVIGRKTEIASKDQISPPTGPGKREGKKEPPREGSTGKSK